MLSSLLVAAWAADDVDSPAYRAAEVFFDLTSNEDGWIEARASFFDLGRKELAFRELGRAPEYTLEGVRFSTADGPLEAVFDDGTWTPQDVPETGTIFVEWRFRPGGMGRHGHQGFVDPTWASFDGRGLLLPIGRLSLRTVRFKYEMPAGWSVAHPWHEEDGWIVATDPRALKSILTSTCVAVGELDIRRRQVGETEVRVASPKSWAEPWRDQLATGTFDLFQWYHDELGFDRRAPFTIAWLPKGDDGQVFGGASVNGACYEQPVMNERAWLLLGHRIAHPMNKYVPAGLTIRDRRDHWFMEGWASYIEVVGADQAGVLPDQRHWNKMYKGYLDTLAKHPTWDVPLSEEARHREAAEFLHYTKGPLVVKTLADLMVRRSGVTLEAFMKHVWSKHGFHRSVWSLREEIAAFTGDDYDDFWALFVDRPGYLYPSWPELRDATLAKRMDTPPAAHVGDLQVHPEYLFWLAWSGHFERFADIVVFLEKAAAAHEALADRDFRVLDEDVYDVRFALPGSAQFAVDSTAIDWPVEAFPQRSGCWGTSASATPRLVWEGTEVAAIFQRLLELEREYEAGLGPQIGEVRVEVRATWARGGSRLAVGPNEDFLVRAVWTTPPSRALFEVLPEGSKATKQSRLTLDPTWQRTHANFEAGDRPPADAILLVGVGRDGSKTLRKPLWQASAHFTPKKDQEPR